MKNIKKLSLFLLMALAYQSINCTDTGIDTMSELGRLNYKKEITTSPTDVTDPISGDSKEYDEIKNWNGTITHTQTTNHIANGEKTVMTETWETKNENQSRFEWFVNSYLGWLLDE